MRNKIGLLLCWLGIHKWWYDAYNHDETKQYRTCKRCHLFQRWDFITGDWL